jgi:ectoine hydroxylase-related dioxygenase (phytanoyl-CoA dioxygenase family)
MRLIILFLTAITTMSLCADRARDSFPQAATLAELRQQREFLRLNGYLWIRDYFSPEQVAAIQGWGDRFGTLSNRIIALADALNITPQDLARTLQSALIVVPEASDPTIVCRTEDMLSTSSDFAQFISDYVTAYITLLQGSLYVPFKDKLNFKWPGGGAFSAHQDFPAYSFLAPRSHVTAMISIDRATALNGALQIASNWATEEAAIASLSPELVQPQGRVVLPYIKGGEMNGSIEPAYLTHVNWLLLETEPTDLVLFDSYIPHYSEANGSLSSRRAFFITHNLLSEGDQRVSYYSTKRNDPANPVFHIGTPTVHDGM